MAVGVVTVWFHVDCSPFIISHCWLHV